MDVHRILIMPFLFIFSGWLGCTNPFAPGELEGDPVADLLGDPVTVEGFYTRFKSAYELRDTSLYGPLIHPDFTFTFRDDDRNVDITWGRSEEMSSTFNMFSQSYDISLRWNNITQKIMDPEQTNGQIVRRFNLTVAVSPSETYRTDGSASFRLIRQDSSSHWRLLAWRDESDL